MYRDDPLDDELELRVLVGDDQVDRLGDERVAAAHGSVEVALDILRILQGWADDDEVARWFTSTQRRLADRTPIDALVEGAFEEVEDAARAWVAARG